MTKQQIKQLQEGFRVHEGYAPNESSTQQFQAFLATAALLGVPLTEDFPAVKVAINVALKAQHGMDLADYPA